MPKAADEGLTKGSVKRFHEKQMTEAVLLCCGWLSEPAKWEAHLRRAAVSTMMSIVYDYPIVKSEQDHTVEAFNDHTHRITRASLPGAHFVESFPWMKHIPSR
jgi:hypothetical protein